MVRARASDVDAQSLARLRALMSQFRSAIVAYSGGVDSAVVLAVANECMGERAVGCIGVSPSLPRRELDSAIAVARQMGARLRTVFTSEHLDPSYIANPANRCYFCKSDLYSRLRAIAGDESAQVIFDGTNASDLREMRHGYIAAKEHDVRSPLAEAGLEKEHVRAVARLLELPVWDKPASPCLASRVPTGVFIMPELLGRIERAENVLAELGFRDFRVRHQGDTARIELPIDALPVAVEKRGQILEGIRAAGYRHVTLDLAGLHGSVPASPAQ